MSVGVVNKQTGERIPTAGMPAIDSVLSNVSTNPVQNRVVKAALDAKADTDIVASDFSADTSYTAGEYCIYGGKFYKFKNNHSGAWAAADVDEIKIAGELSSLMSGLTNLVKRGTVDVTIASGATTGSAYLRVDTVIIARDRMVGVLIGKNDDVYYNPVIISVHNDGAIETRVVGDAPTTSRTYNVIVSYI